MLIHGEPIRHTCHVVCHRSPHRVALDIAHVCGDAAWVVAIAGPQVAQDALRLVHHPDHLTVSIEVVEQVTRHLARHLAHFVREAHDRGLCPHHVLRRAHTARGQLTCGRLDEIRGQEIDDADNHARAQEWLAFRPFRCAILECTLPERETA